MYTDANGVSNNGANDCSVASEFLDQVRDDDDDDAGNMDDDCDCGVSVVVLLKALMREFNPS